MSSSWTPLPLSRGKGSHLRKCIQGTVSVLCLCVLAACGQSAPATNSANTPATAASSGDSVGAISTAPPGANDRPAPLGTTGTAKTADGLPMLQPRGVNASQLFAQKLGDPDDRMNRLETAVQELRNDFDAMAPSIVKLVAVEKDIQELVGQLETLVSGEPQMPPMQAEMLDDSTPYPQDTVPSPAEGNGADGAPLPLHSEPQESMEDQAGVAESAPPAAVTAPPPAPEPAKPAPAATTGSITVTDIRTGEHPGKTRIVLDMDGKASYTADLDNGEKILVIDLPDARWGTAASKTFSNSPLLSAYNVSAGNGGKGSLLILKLKGPASILYQGMMAAENGPGHKIVIDIGQGNGGSVSTQ